VINASIFVVVVTMMTFLLVFLFKRGVRHRSCSPNGVASCLSQALDMITRLPQLQTPCNAQSQHL